MEKRVESLEEFEQEARAFVLGLQLQNDRATLVTLSGELGVGKTAFVKAAAGALGVEEIVNSPTFVLEKIYQLPAPAAGAGFKRLVHIDAYRLESGAALAPLHLDEIMRDPGSLVMLEWPEKVADALPPATTAIAIAVLESGVRQLRYG